MIRHVRSCVTTALLLAVAVLPASSQPAATGEPADLARARAAFSQAGARGNAAAYGSYLADDVTWIDVAGHLRDRQALIAEVKPDAGSATPSPVKAVVYPGGVVITGRRAANNARFVQVWVKNGAMWQLIAHQGSPEGTQAPPPERTPSSKSPAPVGSAADRDAVMKNIAAYAAAAQRGDADAFAELVTDQFMTVSNGGIVLDKSGREEQLRVSGPGGPPVQPLEVSTRVHGTIAVTTDRSGNRADGTPYPPSRRTIVSVKQGSTWRVAALIVTRVSTGR